ncbi:MAG: MarR family transcriptional regulator [Hyphomicrobiaceae bacterium]|nr:MarR family transcriptional regulator [Hyphomicrobiaceae bacterium]
MGQVEGQQREQDEELKAILKSIRRIARAVELCSRQIDRGFGLTLPQLIVLTCVRDLGEVTVKAVSKEADLSPPTVVGILDKLEAKGLIERYRSTRDRRIVHTRLTTAGGRVLREAPPPLGQDFVAAFTLLDQKVRRRNLRAFAQIADLVSGQQLETT